MSDARIIALVGKGGTGKTALSAIIARQMIVAGISRILLIDADPAMGLAITLGAADGGTVGRVREEIIERARKKDQSNKAEVAGMLDYLLLSALQERERYSLLVMGRMDAKGCFCPVNSLLREAIDDLAQSFDYILIDGEAGIEQINREVIKRVDVLIIVTDASQRGIHTAGLIKEVSQKIQGMAPQRIGVVFNRVDQISPALAQKTQSAGLEILGMIPEDHLVAQYDAEGRSLIGLPDGSVAVAAMKPILDDLLKS